MTYYDEQTSLNASFSLSEDNEQFKTLFIAVVIASIASVCVGFSIGYTSPFNTEYTKLRKDLSFASLLEIGAVIGLILGGFFLEYFGRKKGIMLSAFFYTPGWILIGYFPKGTILYTGRMLTGVATGLCSLTVPIYIAEVSSCQYCGRLGVVNQIGITIGIFLAFLLGSYSDPKQSATAAFVIALLMEFLVLFIPESPRWLLAKKKRNEASKTLKWLRGSAYNVEDECNEIEQNLEQQPVAALNDFRTPGLYRNLLYGSFLMIFQQMCGKNAMMFFGQEIFYNTGVSKMPLAVYLTQVLITTTAYFMVDKYGRRKLLMLGAFGMFICNILLGVYFQTLIMYANNKTLESHFHNTETNMKEISNVMLHDSYSWLAITCFVLFLISYSIGWGALPFLLMSEIFPPRLRCFSCVFVLSVNWCLAFFVTYSFISLVCLFQIQRALWLFSTFCFISIFFVYYFVPETKHKTLEEIEHYYQTFYGFRNYLTN
ncbi:solute carrier family 2, facilitated glucose transporter member 8 isoform X2 [Hydra vulgaris]|uniref:Solute carrier family 2, facilitated glucose transporter member 8 isoform X2 n=1 Tax=Hydra vulgaris TaxID=6087 RepID=A0ABM4BRU4_HYDVU